MKPTALHINRVARRSKETARSDLTALGKERHRHRPRMIKDDVVKGTVDAVCDVVETLRRLVVHAV